MIAYVEGVPLSRLAAEHGTPLYVYSRASVQSQCRMLREAFRSYPTLPCYAVKANSNLTVLREIFSNGFGADVVSVGEMEKALAAGAKPGEIVFSGVGKQDAEIERAMDVGIYAFLAESPGECSRLKEIATRKQVTARVGLRINPNIDVKTNPHIATGLYETKFGIPESDARDLVREYFSSPQLKLVGLSCHLGSQILETHPFGEAAASLARFAMELKSGGQELEFIDMGGGLGIVYREEAPPTMAAYAATVLEKITPTGLRLVLEPGRVIVGNCGVLLTRVIGVKRTPAKTFVIVDGAMNDLIRPSLYEAYHDVDLVKPRATPPVTVDVVGPICETGDFLALGRSMSLPEAGDLLVVKSAGAYGSSMASNYNQRPRAAEIWIDGDTVKVARRREALSDLWALEL